MVENLSSFKGDDGGNYSLLGYVSSDKPSDIVLNRRFLGDQGTKETLAHEAEHVRSMSSHGGKPSRFSTGNDKPIDYPRGLMALARNLPGGESLDFAPDAEELVAFLRGKEAVGKLDIDWSRLSPEAKRWFDANVFAGQHRLLEPTKEDAEKYYNRQPSKSRGARILESVQRNVRNFTAK